MQRQEEQRKSREITQNVIQSHKFAGIDIRNWIEAAVWSILIFVIVAQLNFVTKVKWIVLIVLIACAVYINLTGLHGLTVSQLVISEIKFRRSKIRLHLGTPDHERKVSNWSNEEVEGDSYAEKAIFLIKRAYKKYLGR